ncbi:MAG: D-hexose-6-phosphate mutarotase [Pirellula sp.]|jgi:glucose-6-phosphate 1-epimerase
MMTDLEELNELFALEESLSFEMHPSGLTLGRVSLPDCRAEFTLHGAHVLSYQPANRDRSILFVSDQAIFEHGKPIRGGIPICFPWFGSNAEDASLPAHGWARTSEWELIETARSSNQVIVRMALSQDEIQVTIELVFGAELSVDVAVINNRDVPLSFEIALHTYFQIHSIDDVEINGLETVPFVDQLKNVTLPGDNFAIRFTEETDRIYQGIVEQITLMENGANSRVCVVPRGSQSTVVWNPWIEKSKRMADFGDEEYLRMCCVETANVRANKIVLAPGESHTTGVTLQAS